MNEITMNRLVLIGNGFDLAHGLKTSYKDFITDYLRNALEQFLSREPYIDKLFELHHNRLFIGFENEPSLSDFDAMRDFILITLRKTRGVKVTLRSQLLRKLLDNLNEFNWVDIENEYYGLLKSIVKESKGVIDDKYKSLIKKLNDDFEYLGEKLKEYLKSLNTEKSEFMDGNFPGRFLEKIKKEELCTITLKEDIEPKSIYFLNFNYTPTVTKYTTLMYNKNLRSDYNFIHGDLYSNNNPMIFGFGDEFDEDFKKFEDLKNDELFRHIKSFKYSRNSNYHNLIRFIEAENFQVYVMGHSCGLSDRTMLREIFEHNNCKSIKIFYHERSKNSNDFLEKTYNISRHFRDNGLMRKKLVPFEKSLPMPQPRN